MTIEEYKEAQKAEREQSFEEFIKNLPKLPPNVQRIEFTMKVTWDDGAVLEADGNMEPRR